MTKLNVMQSTFTVQDQSQIRTKLNKGLEPTDSGHEETGIDQYLVSIVARFEGHCVV